MEKKTIRYRKIGKKDPQAEYGRNLYAVIIRGVVNVRESSHAAKALFRSELFAQNCKGEMKNQPS